MGGHHGPTRQGARPGGGRALDPRGHVLALPDVFSVPYILKYSRKNMLNFQGIWRTFIFGVFLYCTDKSGNRQKNTIFTLFQLNTESRERVQKVVLPSFIHLMLIKRNPLTRLIKSC